jgi:ribosome-associated translation inhibitor RaiA
MSVRNILDRTVRQEISMQIQVNTDHTIEGHEALAARIRGVVENALSRISDHITRVEVHLIDESGPKNRKNNKRCMMEARLEGRQPIAVTDEAATLDLAVDGAADKLARLIEHTLGKLHEQRTPRTDSLRQEPTFPDQS